MSGRGPPLASAAGPGFLSDRARAFACAGLLDGVNGFAGKLATTVREGSIVHDVLALGGVSAIVWFACTALFVLGHAEEDAVPASGRDRIVLASMIAMAVVPCNTAAALALAAGGAYLAATSAACSRHRRVSLVMLALAGPIVWGRALLALVAPHLLAVDAWLAAAIANVPVHGNVVGFFGQPGVLYVALGCSSVHNISLSILLYISFTQMLGFPLTRDHVLLCGIGAIGMAGVNVLRLAALARFPAHFDYLHTGPGGELFGVASFVVAGATCGLGVVREARRR